MGKEFKYKCVSKKIDDGWNLLSAEALKARVFYVYIDHFGFSNKNLETEIRVLIKNNTSTESKDAIRMYRKLVWCVETYANIENLEFKLHGYYFYDLHVHIFVDSDFMGPKDCVLFIVYKEVD